MKVVRRMRHLDGTWGDWKPLPGGTVKWVQEGLHINPSLVISFKRPDGYVFQYKVAKP